MKYPTTHQKEALQKYINESGKFSIYGMDGIFKVLENKFSNIHNQKYSILTNTGTSALSSAYFGLNLKEGDDVASCIDCHSIPSRKPKRKKGAPKMSKSERLEYHAEAIHYNCVGCHKDVKRKNKEATAPTSCKACHPQK